MMFKSYLIFTLVFLTLYAPAELTRCIFKYNLMNWSSIIELALIWVFYTAFIVIIIRIASRGHGKKIKKGEQ